MFFWYTYIHQNVTYYFDIQKYCIFFFLQNLETLQSNINTNIFGHILWKPKPKNSIDTSDSRKN